MEGGAYADKDRTRPPSLTGNSSGSVTQNGDLVQGDLEAAKAKGAREEYSARATWSSRAWDHLKQDIDADKVSFVDL